ncbi:MAG: D-alanine--D-alanine ligase [Bacteroidia bacterium]|nr:D-alanine--D-alanine ligase [Bacteroidia bacterium]
MKVGIFFGGQSREREVSFAGGRTVYDNLDKALFEPVPIFVDSFGQFILPDWQYIYKGSIRDFYPPVHAIPYSPGEFQVYAENLPDADSLKASLAASIGKLIQPNELKSLMDLAFLCLHGAYGEDGRIQGLLEYLHIPYTGSGILPSALGMNKAAQKNLLQSTGFNSPAFFEITKQQWNRENERITLFETVKEVVGFPCVVKASNQGSSIGISVLNSADQTAFEKAVEKCFFTRTILASEWNALTERGKNEYVRTLADIREGIGLPVRLGNSVLFHPDQVLDTLKEVLAHQESVFLESMDGESSVLVEGFIEGKEFSCIVVEDEQGKALALPPTEIRKGKEVFDYRSKYLPGLSRKITPIELPTETIQAIRRETERLFQHFQFDVYARIDGFVGNDGKIYLNDPNTTSGMMPSSFFFHQAAEIGLNPSQFLTYIIRTSLAARIRDFKGNGVAEPVLNQLDRAIEHHKTQAKQKIKVAVILGGYSSERHISVESGRNIFEKLSSSDKYAPEPIFLTGNSENHLLYKIPINLLLKDNADDIKDKIEHFSVHEVIKEIIHDCSSITLKYASDDALAAPELLSYSDLKNRFDEVFIGLHGRPGEDGALQKQLDALGMPYNGSGVQSSSITINKYETNEILAKHGMNVAKHLLVEKSDWQTNKAKAIETILSCVKYPFIAKPVDDGCSSAVRKVKTQAELEAFATLIFRDGEEMDTTSAQLLNIKPKEEFPNKSVFLVEELISANGALHFLEITGGMLTHYNAQGEVEYELFEASEALSEGEVLSLEEKFLAGQGQNITPARYQSDPEARQQVSDFVKSELMRAAKALNVQGYCRIDAFVRVFENNRAEVVFVEVNSLPGMTPATCIFHQAAINGYKPYQFIDRILEFGKARVGK